MNGHDLYKVNGSEPEVGMTWDLEDEEFGRSRLRSIRPPRPRHIPARPRKPVRRSAPRWHHRRPWSSHFRTPVAAWLPSQGSEFVRWVQTMLNQILNLQLPVDGIMDVQTRSAVRSFQEKNSLPVTGIVGPDTERALMGADSRSSSTASLRPDLVKGGERTSTPTAQEFDFEGQSGQVPRSWITRGDSFSVLATGSSGPFKNWVWPVPVWNGRKPVISNGFDSRPDPRFVQKHGGVDVMYVRLPNESTKLPEGVKSRNKRRTGYFVPSNTIPVLAVDAGVVVQSGKNRLGHSVIIDHGNGYRTFYQHLTAQGLPSKSTRVSSGTPIGFVGHNPSPGGYPLNHLHFEIWPGGNKKHAINPSPILRGLASRRNETPTTSTQPIIAPGPVTEALRSRRWEDAIRISIQSGERDESRLTNMVFYARHPERGGRKLINTEPGFTRLSQEWLYIRNQLVKPALAAAPVSTAPASPSSSFAGTIPPLNGQKEPTGYKVVYRDISGRRVKRGLARYGGGRLDVTLRALRSRGIIQVTDEEIDLFQRISNVETGGQVQALNTWDSGVVSIGFMQWTLLHGKVQEWIERAPVAFRRYGIELDRSRIYKWKKYQQKAIKGAPTADELRWNGWAQRFYLAGLDSDIIAAEVKLARDWLQRHLKRLQYHLKRHGMQADYDLFFFHYHRSPAIRGLFQETYNNLPVAAINGTIGALRTARKEGTVSTTRFLAILQGAIRQAYIKLNDNGENVIRKTLKA